MVAGIASIVVNVAVVKLLVLPMCRLMSKLLVLCYWYCLCSTYCDDDAAYVPVIVNVVLVMTMVLPMCRLLFMYSQQ